LKDMLQGSTAQTTIILLDCRCYESRHTQASFWKKASHQLPLPDSEEQWRRNKTAIRRRILKTPNDIQTPVSPYCFGKISNATMHPTVATIALIASCIKLPHPLMTPSPIKTRPLMLCRTLARMAGARAASLTSCIGVVAFWIHHRRMRKYLTSSLENQFVAQCLVPCEIKKRYPIDNSG
jgi:hypothetical protein